jgi:tRNA threonylcarbamoyladenosine biosynthesis protein TsaE
MKFTRLDYSETDLPDVASSLLAAFENERVFAFFASMGQGKTTLIKELCHVLNVEDTVTSPTFAIVNEYGFKDKSGNVYHFDLYRLKNASEAYDVGFREIILSGAYCFIEWAEVLDGTLPSDHVRIEISTNEKTGLRTLTAKKIKYGYQEN